MTTTLTTQGPTSEPTSTEAEITHLDQRRKQIAIGAVHRSLTSEAAFHLPLVWGWQTHNSNDALPDLQGQLGTPSKDKDEVVSALRQWADHLGSTVGVEAHPYFPDRGWVRCTAVLDGVSVEIWDTFDIPDTQAPADDQTQEA